MFKKLFGQSEKAAPASRLATVRNITVGRTVALDPLDRRRMATLASIGGSTGLVLWGLAFVTFSAFSLLGLAAGLHVRCHDGAGGPRQPDRH